MGYARGVKALRCYGHPAGGAPTITPVALTPLSGWLQVRAGVAAGHRFARCVRAATPQGGPEMPVVGRPAAVKGAWGVAVRGNRWTG